MRMQPIGQKLPIGNGRSSIGIMPVQFGFSLALLIEQLLLHLIPAVFIIIIQQAIGRIEEVEITVVGGLESKQGGDSQEGQRNVVRGCLPIGDGQEAKILHHERTAIKRVV